MLGKKAYFLIISMPSMGRLALRKKASNTLGGGRINLLTEQDSCLNLSGWTSVFFQQNAQ